jgi:hypothetical protein
MPWKTIANRRNLSDVPTLAASCCSGKPNACELTTSNPTTLKKQCNLWALFRKKKKKNCSNNTCSRKVYVIISPSPRRNSSSHRQEEEQDTADTVICSAVSWETEEEVVEEGEEVECSGTEERQRSYLSWFSSLESYVPTRSRSIEKIRKIAHDFDVWREVIVRHKETGEIRSYFVSDKTNRKEWDEPPSGATTIVYQPHQHFFKN